MPSNCITPFSSRSRLRRIAAPLVFTLPAVVASLVCCPTKAVVADEAKMKVFILAGQSNMVGSGVVKELPESLRGEVERVVLRRGGKWVPFRPVGNRFGPEVTFARGLAEAYPDAKLGIIKDATGGTSLLAWAPDWSKEQAERTGNAARGPLYKKLMQQVQPVLEEDVEIAGVLWMQGERDARFEPVAREYEENLRTLIAAFRRDTGRNELPFILGQVNPPPARYPGQQFVREAQAQVAKKDQQAGLVSTEGLPKHKDNLHYNTEGQLELGRRFAKKFLEVAGAKSTAR